MAETEPKARATAVSQQEQQPKSMRSPGCIQAAADDDAAQLTYQITN